MVKIPSRAQDNGVSTKRLRRMTALRIERMRNTSATIRQAWSELDDGTSEAVLDEFDSAINRLQKDLTELVAYHDLPVGQEL